MQRLYYALKAKPSILLSGREHQISIDLQGKAEEGTKLEVMHTRVDDYDESAQMIGVTVHNGAISFPLRVHGEQEHYLRVMQEDGRILGRASVFSLESELFGKVPMKGDFHMHSIRSDGQDAPARVMAYCRSIGLDIAALTDHRLYAPSLEAQNAFVGCGCALIMCPGEEVHLPGNPLHIINFNGSFSVNDLYAKDPAAAESAIDDIESALHTDISSRERRQWAMSKWAFARIREAGGLGIYCHPYWIYHTKPEDSGYYISRGLMDELFAHGQDYDALEVIGGYNLQEDENESNHFQILRYYEEAARGNRLPIVGVSDAHGCVRGSLFGWYYTIAFAQERSAESFIRAIKDYRSVAVESLPGMAPMAYGPFALVKYSQFLMREVFPEHDRLCAVEGGYMHEYLSGRAEAAEDIRRVSQRSAQYILSLFSEGTLPRN